MLAMTFQPSDHGAFRTCDLLMERQKMVHTENTLHQPIRSHETIVEGTDLNFLS
jgi:hypothetical protein